MAGSSAALRSPVIILKMAGSSAALRSVKNEIMQRIQRNFMIPGCVENEIMQRIQRNFMIPGLRIEWEKAEDVVRM
ncbi:hypothetical protein T484DRAFT_1844204 [Baffinella frigidus]|nr:hypothetical protein T484DRAFT_1844204 [Cryptophyta sp. CCMP2293]